MQVQSGIDIFVLYTVTANLYFGIEQLNTSEQIGTLV